MDEHSFAIAHDRHGTLRVEAVVRFPAPDAAWWEVPTVTACIFAGDREIGTDGTIDDESLVDAIDREAVRRARARRVAVDPALAGDWDLLFADYPLTLPKRPRRRGPSSGARVVAFHDRRGVRWSLQHTRVPLSVPYTVPRDRAFWHLEEPGEASRFGCLGVPPRPTPS